MKKYLYSLTIALFVGFAVYAYSVVVPGDCRNPDACYLCHGGHIIGYHDCELCHDSPGDPFPGHAYTPATNCDDCHDYIPDVDPQCNTCHTNPAEANKYDLGCDRGVWSPTGPMSVGRFVNGGSLLQDGRYLVTGGATPPFFGVETSAEIFDPATRTFSLSGDSMDAPRWSHQQTTLADGGVLITGGRTAAAPIPGAVVLAEAELYDPETDSFSPAGSMSVPRRSHRDILLDDGRVLITGGTSSIAGDLSSVSLCTAEIYDPVSGTFSAPIPMDDCRQSHNLVKLLDGRVLAIGGGEGPGLENPLASVEAFNPATNEFTPVGTMNSTRLTSVTTLLRDGKVLIAFAWDGIDVTPNSEIYDPVADTFTPTSGVSVHGKVDLPGTRLLDGTVVCPSGGNEFIQVLPDTSIYRPDQDDFVLAGSVQFTRTAPTSALLKDGSILMVAGLGLDATQNLSFPVTAEIYTPNVVSQAEGLKNSISDLPISAFHNHRNQHILQKNVSEVMALLMDEQYDKAQKKLAQKVIKRFDGCADENSSDDWITACADQDKVYPVANLLKKTLDQILGIALPPQVSITVEADLVDPRTFHFTGTATDPDGGTIVFYSWDFGDGSNSLMQNPSHTYECPGDYTVVLTAFDNDGISGEASVNVNVPYPPGESVSFTCDLFPTMNAFCAKVCHYPASPDNYGLDLTSYAGLMAGSQDGVVVIAGDPDNSRIVQVTSPPQLHAKDVGGEPFNETIRGKFRTWILEGALDN
jgi:hypothetical protein